MATLISRILDDIHLGKSKLESGFKFHIADGRNQIKSPAKAFTPVAVAFTQNAENFQPANNVFNQAAFL